MKITRVILAALLALAVSPAFAQWQTPNHSVPVGRGSGVTGFGSAVPGVAGQPLVSAGPTIDPLFGPLANSGFTPGAANTVKGSLNGTSVADIPIPDCQAVSTALRWTAGTGAVCGNLFVLTGYDMPINAGISSSVNAGALTINLTNAAGSAPTSGSPVLIPFRSTTLTNGTVNWATVSSSLSLTVPSTATLGTSNGTPFRIWVFVSYNAGVPQLGVATCSNSTSIFPCTSWESTLKTTTVLNASATASGTLYTPAAVTLDAVRMVAYCDFANGLVTAGTWASACTTIQAVGPGVKKPGETVQTVSVTTSTAASTTLGPTVTNLTTSITPTATMNKIRMLAAGEGSASVSGVNTQMTYDIRRNAGTTIVSSQSRLSWASSSPISSGGFSGNVTLIGVDSPGVVTSQTYAVYQSTTAGTAVFPESGVPATMILDEIMG